MDYVAAYERSWQQGCDALRNGRLRVERPPGRDQSGRWGVSVLLWPDLATAKRLTALVKELSAIVGPHCWAHDEKSLHFTVRALERYRETIAVQDERVRLYREAVAETAAISEPVCLDLVGLTLARNGVLVCGVPVDETAQRLREQLGKALSVRGVADLETDILRDMWHGTLLHYTGPPADPAALIAWVSERRGMDLGRVRMDRMTLCRTGYDDHIVRLRSLATVLLRYRSAPRSSKPRR